MANKDDKYLLPLQKKNVQISLGLFVALARIVLFDDDDPELYELAKKGIESKFDSMYKHELFTKYHNKNLSPAEREAARQKYLDEVGMHPDFRWPEEYENYNS